jgi:uncharacterized low-complexity protein
MKKYLALAAVAGGLALGVPAAFAATQSPETHNTPVQSATPTPDQSAPDNGPGGRGGRGDCPEHDGSGNGNGGGSGDQSSTAPDSTATPDI